MLPNVLVVHNHYQYPGGEDAVFSAEESLLRENGHRTYVFTEDNNRIGELSRWTAACRLVWSHASRVSIRKLLQEKHPGIVHFHNTLLLISPSAYYACQEANTPVVQTLHNYRLVCPGATLHRNGGVCEDCLGAPFPWPSIVHGCWRGSSVQTSVVAAMLGLHRGIQTWQRQVDLYIALTEFARRKFVEGGLPSEKIAVKPNFVHPDPGTGESRGTYALFVGRISPEKGITTMLKAWRSLKDIPLRIAGDGPLMNEMRTYVSGCDGNIDIVGHRAHRDVLALMKGARFLVFPSEWYEGFPLTIVEAFACGVPVIASRLGAMSEIVEDRRTGLHFDVGNAEDLAAKVSWAWEHPQTMQQMGKMARQQYETKYTAQKNYEQLMAIYKRAIASHF